MKITIDLQAEIGKSEKRLSDLKTAAAKEETKLSVLRELAQQRPASSELVPQGPAAPESADKSPHFFDWFPVYQVAREILSRSNAPIRTSVLMHTMKEAGVKFPDGPRGELKSFSARLGSRPEFVSHGKGGWTLAKN